MRVGQKVRPGGLLMSVSGRPVFLLHGRIPAYRDLRPGDTGKDVAQLQRALAERGYRTGSDKAGRYGPGTARAVEEFYSHLGFRPQPASPDDEATVADICRYRDAVLLPQMGAREAATGDEHNGRAARRTHRRLAGLSARDETAARSHDTPVRRAKPQVLRVGSGRKHKRNDKNPH